MKRAKIYVNGEGCNSRKNSWNALQNFREKKCYKPMKRLKNERRINDTKQITFIKKRPQAQTIHRE